MFLVVITGNDDPGAIITFPGETFGLTSPYTVPFWRLIDIRTQ
jgi:hypothetical protein